MQTLAVPLADGRSYPIYIGTDLLADGTLLRRHIRGRKVLVVSNALVAGHYLAAVRTACAGLDLDEQLLPDGES